MTLLTVEEILTLAEELGGHEEDEKIYQEWLELMNTPERLAALSNIFLDK